MTQPGRGFSRPGFCPAALDAAYPKTGSQRFRLMKVRRERRPLSVFLNSWTGEETRSGTNNGLGV